MGSAPRRTVRALINPTKSTSWKDLLPDTREEHRKIALMIIRFIMTATGACRASGFPEEGGRVARRNRPMSSF